MAAWLATGALVVYPLGLLLAQAALGGAAGGGWAALAQPAVRAAFLRTVATSGLAAALALGAATALALLTERGRPPGGRWLRLGVALPVLVPPFVGAFGWVQVYGPAGLLDQALALWVPGLFGGVGVTLLLAVHAVPLVYLPVAAALASQDCHDQERAARACGASALASWLTVTLPLLRPALAAGVGLAFVSSASDFGIPAVVGTPARFSTVTTEIYRGLSFAGAGSFASAAQLAAGLAALAALGLLLVGRFGRGMGFGPGTGAALRAAGPGRGARLGALAGWLYGGGVSGLPLLAVTLVALTRAYGLPPMPANWTLAHVSGALASGGGAALLRSLGLAAVAACLAVALGLLTAAAGPGRAGAAARLVAALPLAVPGSAVAMAATLAFSRWLYGTLAIIALAYVARFWALGARPLSGALALVGPEPVRAARASGATPVAAALVAV